METFRKYLEGSIRFNKVAEQIQGIPDKFYCACEFKNAVGDWAKGKLDGLRGLTVDPDFINSRFLDLRKDTLAVFPFDETDSKNDIKAIRYNDPEFLVKNDMEALERIWNSRNNMVEDLVGNMEGLADFNLDNHEYFRTFELLAENHGFVESELINSFVDDVNDLIDKLFGIAEQLAGFDKNIKIPPKNENVLFIVEQAVLEVADQFESEQEWLVENEVFNVPESTVLIVSRDVNDTIQNTTLKDKYDYIFVDSVGEAKKQAKQFNF